MLEHPKLFTIPVANLSEDIIRKKFLASLFCSYSLMESEKTLGRMTNLSKEQKPNCWRAVKIAYITSFKQTIQTLNTHILTLKEEIFAEEIFVEFNFAILGVNREIKFRETRQNSSFAKLNSAKSDFFSACFLLFLTRYYQKTHDFQTYNKPEQDFSISILKPVFQISIAYKNMYVTVSQVKNIFSAKNAFEISKSRN